MKVIIRDLETRKYFSPNGQWVAAAIDAKDFCALVPAYNFAKQNTRVRFQIILYCPDDNYHTGIIDGMGMATSSEVTPSYAQSVTTATLVRRNVRGKPQAVVHFPVQFDTNRNHLN
jgi:hypothetical protein